MKNRIAITVEDEIYSEISRQAAYEGMTINSWGKRILTIEARTAKTSGSAPMVVSEPLSGPIDITGLLDGIKDKPQEHFVVITLNSQNQVIKRRIITIGTVNSTQIHPREVFADAITDRAVSMVLAHNHPSGTKVASSDDVRMTNQLIEGSKILGINILDHIIITPKNGYLSFIEAGLMDAPK